ncbi:MAG: tRNA (adenosine(37)-N6)-threonylcarbamoyltransferase complex dimerization subunit type 1 TsaB [Nocardiopsaceae bacterium]|nr:tRNA (adenosine(37)-N6)-threonylcarbamoyltransferase complex dimerization subunit type 1 TsaB [Nocardiopsaceae bacterium]
MLILGLDTATPAVTVALHDGERPLAQLVTVDARRHAELLAPAISRVIADAGATRTDLTAIVAGVGPGPYTGLRVGLVTGRVLGAALGIPVYGLCSLDVIAADVEPPGTGFLVATDARRREVYWASYDAEGNREDGPAVNAPADVPRRGRPVAGEGARLYPSSLPGDIGPAYPAATTLCRMAAFALASGDSSRLLPPEPLYLRRPDAREPGAPKRVSQ